VCEVDSRDGCVARRATHRDAAWPATALAPATRAPSSATTASCNTALASVQAPPAFSGQLAQLSYCRTNARRVLRPCACAAGAATLRERLELALDGAVLRREQLTGGGDTRRGAPPSDRSSSASSHWRRARSCGPGPRSPAARQDDEPQRRRTGTTHHDVNTRRPASPQLDAG